MTTGKERYRQYLQSSDWKGKRNEKLSKRRRCGICGYEESLDVHHLNYRNWYDVKQSDLRRLCRRCHETAHELMKEGKIVFRSDNHNHRFTLTKTAVKKHLNLTNQNLFWPKEKDSSLFDSMPVWEDDDVEVFRAAGLVDCNIP